MSILWLLVGLAAGAAAGWWLARRGSGPAVAPGVSPHLLPDPALEWLRRSHQAFGVWVSEMDAAEGAPHSERIVEQDRLSVAAIVAVDRRLERARDQEQNGVERMEGGTLVFRAAGGSAVALLLPAGQEAARLGAVESDLQRLLEGVRRRPHLVQLTQARAQEASLESASSVGLRLAYQLERLLGGQVVVAAFENLFDAAGGGPVVPRVRIIGVSGRADRRLLDTVLPAESDLARAATGTLDHGFGTGDPLASVVADRRQRPAAVLVLPLRDGERTAGAVAMWLPGGTEPTGRVRTELMEILAAAGPRVVTALDADRIRGQTEIDPLTGLQNRKGLELALHRAATTAAGGAGALIFADLDRFKQLNDTLGHPAGDAALVHFARIIREQIRSGDVAARSGGEEFAVWLPDTGLDLGARIAERIRLKLDTTQWAWQGRAWPLSASFGVAACPETTRDPGELYGQADAALYVAKRSGRNRVEKAGLRRSGS